ncbi:MAG: hypothetical protein JWL72_2078 [Ilumatobacteraceae bacterium]|nr:hypothetical protein [Ilumatobacteraceae bacterium]MCU1388740.1 hypothetical protein [Ilumatobacteraceae bacterium]
MSELVVENRPTILVGIVGVGTAIGKTWTTARVLRALRERGISAAARKPAQSYAETELGTTDAEVLSWAGGDLPLDVCPEHRWYPVPMAPPMAAEVLGLGRIEGTELLGEIHWPSATHVGLVETVGGVRSPMTHDTDSAGFVALLRPDRILLVADAGLGTINSVRLSIEALDVPGCLVFLNRFDGASDLHRRNRDWLTFSDGHLTATDVDDVCAWILGEEPPVR